MHEDSVLTHVFISLTLRKFKYMSYLNMIY